jgi:hypothetical protein
MTYTATVTAVDQTRLTDNSTPTIADNTGQRRSRRSRPRVIGRRALSNAARMSSPSVTVHDRYNAAG